jgi:hypothetical protein
MHKTKNPQFEPYLIFLIFVSLFGLALSFAFVTSSSGSSPDGFELRKPVIGSIFGVLCVLGIFAAIYPNSCSRLFDYEKDRQVLSEKGKRQEINIRGHHPTCEKYLPHILKIHHKTFCATCTGFSVGAIVALIGTGFFFFGSLNFGKEPFIALIAGSSAVSIGLLHSILPGFKIGFSRFIASTFFASGSFLIIASVEDTLHNTTIDLFFVILSVLWLMTDTALSRWDHRRICAKCISESCNRK